MFDSLSGRLGDVLRRLRGAGRLGERELTEALRDVRLALLEADVNYKVVRDLVERIRARAASAEVLDSLNPGQNVVRVVRDELCELMGGSRSVLELRARPATVLLMGLQGAGKTTTAAKLAVHLAAQGRRPALTTADVHRPAAAEQLRVLGADVEIPVFHDAALAPTAVPDAARSWAKANARDVVIVDTAGRQQVDDGMMDELDAIASAAVADETLLVVDAMSGQDAVNVAASFADRAGMTGVVLTKLDGDARGGAALSILAVTGTPIKFVGVGEKADQLEAFHPDRMASRILGMGDVLTLIEQAEGAIDEERAQRVAEHIATQRLTLQDFLEQMEEMAKLGPLSQVLERLPVGRKRPTADDVNERDVAHALAILRAMTVEERLKPSIIGGSRKKRIARGSGTRVRDVNRLLSQFEDARRAFRQLGGRHSKSTLPFDLPNV